MAFIEPMYRNKPNITYLLTYFRPEESVNHLAVCFCLDGLPSTQNFFLVISLLQVQYEWVIKLNFFFRTADNEVHVI